MATKTQSRSVARPSKTARTSKPGLKKAKLVKAKAKTPARKPAPAASSTATSSSRKGSRTVERGVPTAAPSTNAQPLLKQFIENIGPLVPSGKLFSADGVAVAPAAGGIQVMQVAPRPDRMSWIYTTLGIASTPAAKHSKPYHLELTAHWKVRDPKTAARILTTIAKHTLDKGIRLVPGDIITTDETMDLRADGILHWLVCPPDRATPSPVKSSLGNVHILVLLGMTEDELQMGLRVRPELANGRQVLLEAMRSGGVYPVSDPARGCMTRRRDFHRVWEGSFRTVREKHPPAAQS